MAAEKVIVIGSGFSGISAATCLADHGYEVTVLEKNSAPGGRARSLKLEDFTFDMGPSWYWMPDVFEKYFQRFGKSVADYYQLKRLDPSYRVFFKDGSILDVPASLDAFKAELEELEPGSGEKLEEFLRQAAHKYEVGINDLVYKPGRSLGEFVDTRVLLGLFKMDLFQSMSNHVRKFFKNEKIIELMEFPVLFLGAKPEKTPALYSMMNYADIKLGTWFPSGGMYQIVEGMVKLAEEKGVKFRYNEEVEQILVEGNTAKKVKTIQNIYETDVVVAGADYHHVDRNLLEPAYRNYTEKYWGKRVMAPSSLIFYLGTNKKLKNLLHHNLFFDRDFKQHAHEIYDDPQWPSDPLFYVSVTSKTDPSAAPKGGENVFILIPVAPGLEDNENIRDKYFDMVIKRLEKLTDQEIAPHIVVKKSFAHKDFQSEYHAFKGNAYGLANTLLQTAILKPSLKNKKVKNLYYTGQLTVPGPGVPPSIISGQVVAKEIEKEFAIA